jgi:peroxiredoxin Q/BCP
MKTLFIISMIMIIPVFSIAQVALGGKVPNFEAFNQDGEEWVFKNHLRSTDYLVIYFYPAAFTGGCTQQACTYRDQKNALAAVNAQVIGISGDRPETLHEFSLEHQLNFTLLSDETGTIADMFGVPRKEGGSIQHEISGRTWDLARGTTIKRWTFIVDRKGTLIYRDTEVNAAEDSSKVLEFISSL